MAPKVPKNALGCGQTSKDLTIGTNLGGNGGNSPSLLLRNGKAQTSRPLSQAFCRRSPGGKFATHPDGRYDQLPLLEPYFWYTYSVGTDLALVAPPPGWGRGWGEGACVPCGPAAASRFIRRRHNAACPWHTAHPRERRFPRKKLHTIFAIKCPAAACTSRGSPALMPSTPESPLPRSGKGDITRGLRRRRRTRKRAPASTISPKCPPTAGMTSSKCVVWRRGGVAAGRLVPALPGLPPQRIRLLASLLFLPGKSQ